MTSRYRVKLGNVQLDSLDDRILILDVGYSQLEKNVSKYTTANLDGFDIHDEYISRQTVTVNFELRIYDTVERNEVLQRINEWAMLGGNLQVNDREEQYLSSVVCDQPAVLASVRNWTDPLTLVFSTTTNPYWLSSTPKTLTLSGKSAGGTLKMNGNIGDALVNVSITTEGTISSLQIVVGSTKLVLKGLSVPSGKKIVIDYIRDRYLRIIANGSSILSKLQTESTDDLHAKCGKDVNVSITANNKITAVFSGRGMWL